MKHKLCLGIKTLEQVVLVEMLDFYMVSCNGSIWIFDIKVLVNLHC